MKKIYVQVIDKATGIYQCGMIEEPVIRNKEIENALAHFGIVPESIIWNHKEGIFGYGESEGTSKIFQIIEL
jgi:hypothetical protein